MRVSNGAVLGGQSHWVAGGKRRAKGAGTPRPPAALSDVRSVGCWVGGCWGICAPSASAKEYQKRPCAASTQWQHAGQPTRAAGPPGRAPSHPMQELSGRPGDQAAGGRRFTRRALCNKADDEEKERGTRRAGGTEGKERDVASRSARPCVPAGRAGALMRRHRTAPARWPWLAAGRTGRPLRAAGNPAGPPAASTCQ